MKDGYTIEETEEGLEYFKKGILQTRKVYKTGLLREYDKNENLEIEIRDLNLSLNSIKSSYDYNNTIQTSFYENGNVRSVVIVYNDYRNPVYQLYLTETGEPRERLKQDFFYDEFGDKCYPENPIQTERLFYWCETKGGND